MVVSQFVTFAKRLASVLQTTWAACRMARWIIELWALGPDAEDGRVQFKHRRYLLLEEASDDGRVTVSLPAVALSVTAPTRSRASMLLKQRLKVVIRKMQTGQLPVPPSDAVPSEGYMVVEVAGADLVDG